MGDPEMTIIAQQGTAKPPQRLRLSIWAGSNLVTPSAVKGGEKIIDDITLLKTLSVNTEKDHVARNKKGKLELLKPLEVRFDPGVQPAPDTFYGDAIDACHQVGIQCLAGWDMARNDLPMQAMSLWFKDLHDGKFSDTAKEINRVVQQILVFMNQDFHTSDKVIGGKTVKGGKTVHFDGISFDMEQVAVEVSGDAIAFYQAVADGLATATKDTNKFCGVAAGQLVDDTHAHFVRDSNGIITHKQQAIASAIAHKWSMANGHALLVVRPMAYDDWPLTNLPTAAKGATPGAGNHQQPPSVITQWHNDMMDFAAKTGVPPEQFQLGIKTFLGDGNKPRLIEKPPGTFSWAGHDGCMIEPSEIRRRCRELRKRAYGLILFAFPQDSVNLPHYWGNVASYNFVLNANHSVPTAFDDKPSSASDPEFRKSGNAWDGTILPATLGVPRQEPHTLNTLDRLKNA